MNGILAKDEIAEFLNDPQAWFEKEQVKLEDKLQDLEYDCFLHRAELYESHERKMELAASVALAILKTNN